MNLFSTNFIKAIDTKIKSNYSKYADLNKFKIYKLDKTILNYLDFENDTIFLNPLIFRINLELFHSEKFDLAHLFIKDLDHSKYDRPIVVKTDSLGYVYLPGVGYIKSSTVDSFIEINCSKDDNQFIIFEGNKQLELIPLISINNFEICDNSLPLVNQHFKDNYEVEVNRNANLLEYATPKIKTALDSIHKLSPYFYSWMEKTLSPIVVFEAPSVWSFGTASFLGVPFLSTNPKRSEIFYQEDIIHQGAHNILYYAIHLERENLFTVSPHDNMKQHSGDENDTRTVYSAFHGLFTQSNINQYFNNYLEANKEDGLFRYEIIGRLADNMKRWAKAIQVFNEINVFTDEGKLFFREFENVYHTLHEKYGSLIHSLDVSNQPYIFDFDSFLELNPYGN